ncbi:MULTISPECIES: OmpA family protein [Herbaspirillum]|uniref:OmpA family protein n=2 Tax=Herbaspirillum huttiense TaxID=863372 RepID=A0AAJ2H5A0_9BURK|nr:MULTISPECIES: OmpA family protein [Herbaspirillum]MDR9837054.1 OmpA family protein [Herbaspirillum huttiense]
MILLELNQYNMNRKTSFLLISPLIVASFAATGADLHQVIIPQRDTVVIAPEQRGDIVGAQTRAVTIDRSKTSWIVLERAKPRAMLPSEEARIDNELRSLSSRDAVAGNAINGLLFPFDKVVPFSWDPIDAQLDTFLSAKGPIVVTGHSDEVGSAEYNVKLSRRRAEAVVRYLVISGVPKRQLKVVAMGKSMPIPNASAALNRRVVITLTGAAE